MRFSRITLTNWKNFTSADVALPNRAFLIGPNASGKSNFLDAFRFLRDLAVAGGGLQRACDMRGGVSKIRCLAARKPPGVGIKVELDDDGNTWSYELVFKQRTQFPASPVVESEMVKRNGEILLSRPNDDDRRDERLLIQTALEQIYANKAFRAAADHFAKISYLHLIPQMIRDSTTFPREFDLPDMYGGHFLERIARTHERTRKAWLRRISELLKIVVPQLEKFDLQIDDRGIPHLVATYKHWRPSAGLQNETQFSDGTLRLIGLLWMLQEGAGLLLMEEPELSLHKGVISQLAPFIHKAQMRAKDSPRQVLISTHSVDLLSDSGIDASELILFQPTEAGTKLRVGAEIAEVVALMESGMSAGDAALPYTQSPDVEQMRLFEL
ncbi:MAG: AAA family ATPase [Anaerolineae bacterium]|nr:AAA family ATPase [Anaerolineae bacterium]